MDDNKMIVSENSEYEELISRVGEVLEQGRRIVVQAVNSAMVQTYWE